MALLLSIDTSTSGASVCLSQNDLVLSRRQNSNQKDHASWVHTTIDEMLKETGTELSKLDAIAVTSGPGSYTGLRVGMATAKGLCYACKIPFITVSTLEAMALAALPGVADYVCPMIDARRMEVFTAVYDQHLNIIRAPLAVVLDQTFFLEYLDQHTMLFTGDGAEKFRKIIHHPNAFFNNSTHDCTHVARLAAKKFEVGEFADLAYAEPQYLKDFYSAVSK